LCGGITTKKTKAIEWKEIRIISFQLNSSLKKNTVVGKTREFKKLENPAQNTSFESIVGARPAATHATEER